MWEDRRPKGAAIAKPNALLRAARERTPSRRTPGTCMSRAELADLVVQWLAAHDDRGRDVAFDAGHLGKIERGAVGRPRAYYVAALCAVLDATEAELGLDPAYPSLSRVALPAADDEPVPDSDMERGEADFGSLLSIVKRTWKLRRAAGDPLVLGQVDLAISDLAERYETEGPRPLVRQMVELRTLVEQMLTDSLDTNARQRLISQGARLCGMLAYAATNLGRFTMARAYGLEAFALATTASRSDLLAWIRGTQSFTEYYAGKPGESLKLAQDGQRFAQGGAESVRLAINGEARAAAILGDGSTARRAIRRAYSASNRLGAPADLTPCLSFDVYGEARTAANAATTLLHLGETAAVLEHTAEVIRIADFSESMWTRSLARLDRAKALVTDRSPQPEESATLGMYVAATPGVMLIESVRQRTATLVRDLSPWRTEPRVSEFLDHAPRIIRSTTPLATDPGATVD
jgi:hypothetical protein